MHVVSFIVDAAPVGSRRHMHRGPPRSAGCLRFMYGMELCQGGVAMGDHDENHWGQQEEWPECSETGLLQRSDVKQIFLVCRVCNSGSSRVCFFNADLAL